MRPGRRIASRSLLDAVIRRTAAVALVALLVGLLAGHLWWGRQLQRAQSWLETTRQRAAAPAARPGEVSRAAAVVDLATREGVSLVEGQWRYSDRHDTATDGPGPGAAVYDDSAWPILDPAALGQATTGQPRFTWHRISVRIPSRVGSFDARGSTVVLEVVADGYAEIWVDGRPPAAAGAGGDGMLGGGTGVTRVVIARDAQPGERVQLAVLSIRGPLWAPPPGRAGLRSATLDFHALATPTLVGGIVRQRPALDAIVAPGARIEKIADRFLSLEGPVWAPEGYLLFSDFSANAIYRWSPDAGVSVHRTKSGYSGFDIGDYPLPGSNGLAVDREGRLTIAEHGRRRVTRVERDGAVTVLAHRHEGRRLNSPNDLVYRSDGSLYFTDPPYGLPKAHADPRRELPYSGVFRWVDGALRLLTTDLSGPNGLAFSPDERHLYVSNWDRRHAVVLRYEVTADGGLANGRVFLEVLGDGLKVDRQGNLYVAGPAGVAIVAPDGEHVGTLRPPEPPTNLAWGDDDRRTLYITAGTGLYRIRTEVPGAVSTPPRAARAGAPPASR